MQATVERQVALLRTAIEARGTEQPTGRPNPCEEGYGEGGAAPGSPASLRRRVFRQDRGICAACGIDDAALGAALAAEWGRVKAAITPDQRRERAAFRRRYRWWFRRRSCWDAHHVVPVGEGGADTLANLRTLCVPCHQRVTKQQARDRASRRRRRDRFGGRDGWAAIPPRPHVPVEPVCPSSQPLRAPEGRAVAGVLKPSQATRTDVR